MVFVGPRSALYNQDDLMGLRVAAGTFLVQDSGAVSTSKLLLQIAKEKETEIVLVSIPKVLRGTLKLIAPQIYKRLLGSLVLDDSATRDVLNFKPPYSFEEGIRLMIKNY